MGVWVSYLYSVIYSEQLSYTRYFDPVNLYQYREITDRWPGRGVSMFGVLGGCGRQTDNVFLFVAFF